MIKIQDKIYQNPKAILLDKDGTLVEIEALHLPLMERRAQTIAELAGVPVNSHIIRSWGINPITRTMDIRGPFMMAAKEEEKIVATVALYQQGLDWSQARSIVEKAYEVDESATNPANWNQPIENVIAFIKAANKFGIQLGIVTGDTTLRAIEACETLGVKDKMSHILGVDQVRNDKPSPDLVLEFCKRARLEANEVAIIGDSIKDMQMAKQAGAKLAIALESGVTSADEFIGVADHIIQNFSEIEFIQE